ncbi:MAG: hypothetical protein L0H96_03500 [Humibacillus sp.]|nr:hypothetical protein [Humibacillus sp.]MDN5775956.1 hypothetical protein [Humibacillus sp.]
MKQPGMNEQGTDEQIGIDSILPPRLHRSDEDGVLSDYQGYLHAPVTWTHERDLEKLWNRKHSSRLGVGLCVAGSPRRHFMISNVRHSIDWARSELEVLIAELEQTTDAVVGAATVGPIETATDDEAAGPAQN